MINRLRGLTRYRKKLVQDRAKETQRVQPVLEDVGIKLDSVVTEVMERLSPDARSAHCRRTRPADPCEHGPDQDATEDPQ